MANEGRREDRPPQGEVEEVSEGPRDVAHADTSLVKSVAAAAPPTSNVTRQGTYLGASGEGSAEASTVDTERYESRGFIAAGGMGEVWRVYDRQMERLLAMKVLAPAYAADERARARFSGEAKVTALLQHPGIVAVHDLGTLADGRPYFTMKEVRGRTLLDRITELHRDPEPLSARRGRLRDMVDLLLRVTEAVGYAHSAGVVHRDLKPQNVMVGRFGEVQVMDWGLAIRMDDVTGRRREVAGTFAYMAPEQARGDHEAVAPTSDVYALGAMLYEMLAGEPPYAGARSVHAAVLDGPPRALAFDDRDLVGLAAIAARAMARDPAERYPNAEGLTEAIRAWQNETRRRNRGLELVGDADEAWRGEGEEGIAAMRARMAELRRQAAAILEDVQPYDPVEKKTPAWRLEDEAAEIEHRAAVAEVQWQQQLRAALNEDPELPEAHERLADYYKDALDEADQRGDRVAIKRAEALLRIHDRGKYRSHLAGEARLTLVTSPPGARVTLHRFESVDRRLVPRVHAVLGETPLVDVVLTAGSYLLLLEKDGHHPVRYPIHLPRAGVWDGVPPGETDPFPIELPPLGTLGEDDVYVPAGYFIAGGDPRALESAPRERPWVDAFVIRRFQVTRGEYIAYLNDLCDEGRKDEARRRAPKRPGQHDEGEALAWPTTKEGRFQLEPGVDDPSQARWPMTLVDWEDACAYAAWLSCRDGHRWRLPMELEWEKAARGVDGRRFPWGDHFDAQFACVAESHEQTASLHAVSSFADDASVFGTRGMAGNARDWCCDLYRRNGPHVASGRCVIELHLAPAPEMLRSGRGGSWHTSGENVACASRTAGRPGSYYPGLGFRLVRAR